MMKYSEDIYIYTAYLSAAGIGYLICCALRCEGYKQLDHSPDVNSTITMIETFQDNNPDNVEDISE